MSPRTLRLVEPNDRTDDPGTELKVAFATEDMRTVDAHFNKARTFAVHAVGATSSRLVEVLRFDDGEALPKGDNSERVAQRIEAIRDCAMLFVAAIGGPTAAKVVNHKIHPVKAREGEAIDAIIARLQETLQGAPPPWMRKALEKDRPRDLSSLEDEDHDV